MPLPYPILCVDSLLPLLEVLLFSVDVVLQRHEYVQVCAYLDGDVLPTFTDDMLAVYLYATLQRYPRFGVWFRSRLRIVRRYGST